MMKKLPENQKSNNLMIRNSTAEFLMFTADSRQDGLEVRFQDETVWLTQKLMAELFQCSTDNISLHLKNIFKDGELLKKSVTEEFSVTASDGFLKFNQREILDNPGKISAEIAKYFSESEWVKYRIVQDRLFESDFDQEVKKLLDSKKKKS